MGAGDLSVSESFEELINGRAGGYRVAARPSLYSEEFEKVCPYYIAFGMSYDEFWNGDCEIAPMYRKAHEARMNEANTLAWLQGVYVYHAVGALAPTLKAFSKGRAQAYMKEPFGFQEREVGKEIAKAKERKEQKDSTNKARAILEMWSVNYNERWDKAQEEKKLKEEINSAEGGEAIGRSGNDSGN